MTMFVFRLQRLLLLSVLVAGISVADAAATRATTTAASMANARTTESIATTILGTKKIQSLPLIPHHVYQRRHRQRQRELTVEGEIEEVDKDAKLARRLEVERLRSHYPRRQLEEQQQQPQNLRQLQIPGSGDVQVAALFQGFGTHYADLWCGTPPQRQTVIVDTGSGVTAFPCSGCPATECGVPKYHIDPLWVESDSSTFYSLNCNECLRGSCRGSTECIIGMSYQEGSSWTAYEVQDKCYVGGLHDEPITVDYGTDPLDPHHAAAYTFNLKFGCQTHLTGLFKTQLADGIMGMDSADASFWAQMSKELGVKREFSLCFSRSPSASREGTAAGAMTLGGFDSRLHQSDMVFTSTSQSRGFYNVYLRKVFLREGNSGDSALSTNPNAKIVQLNIDESSLNRGSVIVDSGTTDTYFNRALSAPFAAAWHEIMGSSVNYDHRPVVLTEAELQALPVILFQVAGDEELNKQVADFHNGEPVAGIVGAFDPDHPYDVFLAVPASHFYEYDEDSQDYTARFYTDEGGGSVLGANSMMGHDVYFDVDNNRIGWAESSCDYETIVQPFLKENPADVTREQTPDVPVSDPAPVETPPAEVAPPDVPTPTEETPTTNTEETGTGGTIVDVVPEEPEVSPTDYGSEETTAKTNEDESEYVGNDDGYVEARTNSLKEGFCSSKSCRNGALAGMVLACVVGFLIMKRRNDMVEAYEVAASELELQTRPAVDSHGRAKEEDGENAGFTNLSYYDVPGGYEDGPPQGKSKTGVMS